MSDQKGVDLLSASDSVVDRVGRQSEVSGALNKLEPEVDKSVERWSGASDSGLNFQVESANLVKRCRKWNSNLTLS